VSRFFDSLTEEVRDGAWTWLVSSETGAIDPALFARLLETPYADVRLRLVELLKKKASLPGVSASDLGPVWASVLLGVERGGRQKLAATAQIARALVSHPEKGPELAPVLAVAVRSIRGPERRAGLAAVMQVIEETPQLAEAIRAALPELKTVAEGAA
jgi:hypothetical protein